MRRKLFAFVVAVCVPVTLSCASDGPAGPSSAEIAKFVEALRGRGFSVSLGEKISPSNNGFFSVPAQVINVNTAHVNVFEYATAADAAAEAHDITKDGNPSPTVHPFWVSRSQFYHQGSLIVLYLGCDAGILQALEAMLGAPIGIGTRPC